MQTDLGSFDARPPGSAEHALAEERALSASLAEAASQLQRRARTAKTLLTLELVAADDALSMAHAAVHQQGNVAAAAASRASILQEALVVSSSSLDRASCENIAVLGSEIAGLEAAFGTATAQQHAAIEMVASLRAQLADEQADSQRTNESLVAGRAESSSQVHRLENDLSEARARLHATNARVSALASESDEAQRLLAARAEQGELERRGREALISRLAASTTELRAAADARAGTSHTSSAQHGHSPADDRRGHSEAEASAGSDESDRELRRAVVRACDAAAAAQRALRASEDEERRLAERSAAAAAAAASEHDAAKRSMQSELVVEARTQKERVAAAVARGDAMALEAAAATARAEDLGRRLAVKQADEAAAAAAASLALEEARSEAAANVAAAEQARVQLAEANASHRRAARAAEAAAIDAAEHAQEEAERAAGEYARAQTQLSEAVRARELDRSTADDELAHIREELERTRQRSEAKLAALGTDHAREVEALRRAALSEVEPMRVELEELRRAHAALGDRCDVASASLVEEQARVLSLEAQLGAERALNDTIEERARSAAARSTDVDERLQTTSTQAERLADRLTAEQAKSRELEERIARDGAERTIREAGYKMAAHELEVDAARALEEAMASSAAARDELREALQSAHAAELLSAVDLERELRASIELKHASELAAVQQKCDDDLAEQNRMVEAYRGHLESLRTQERRETQEDMHARLQALWEEEKATLEADSAAAVLEAREEGNAALEQLRTSLEQQHTEAMREQRLEMVHHAAVLSKEAADKDAIQESALESTESECRRLFSEKGILESRCSEYEGAALANGRRAAQLQTTLQEVEAALEEARLEQTRKLAALKLEAEATQLDLSAKAVLHGVRVAALSSAVSEGDDAVAEVHRNAASFAAQKRREAMDLNAALDTTRAQLAEAQTGLVQQRAESAQARAVADAEIRRLQILVQEQTLSLGSRSESVAAQRAALEEASAAKLAVVEQEAAAKLAASESEAAARLAALQGEAEARLAVTEADAAEQVARVEAETREAIAVTLLEKAEAVRSARAQQQVAADETLQAADAKWRQKASRMDETHQAAEAKWREQVSRLETELEAARNAMREERTVLLDELTRAQNSITAAEADALRKQHEAADQQTVLAAEVAAMEVELAKTLPQLRAAAQEGAVARAQELMATSELLTISAQYTELESSLARTDELRDAAQKRADEQTRAVAEMAIELKTSRERTTSVASAAAAAEEQAVAEGRAAAERLEDVQRAAEERQMRAVSAAEQDARAAVEREMAALRAEMHVARLEGEAALRTKLESEWAMERREREAKAVHAAAESAASAADKEQRLRDDLRSAHAAELESVLDQERELREALELKHASLLGAVRQQADAAVRAARDEAERRRLEVEQVRQEWSETGATQEDALESTESECRKLYAQLKATEAKVAEVEAASLESEARAVDMQAQLDAATHERGVRAKQSSAERLQLRSLAGQIEVLGAQLERAEAAGQRTREEMQTGEKREAEARRERDDAVRFAWQLCEGLERLHLPTPGTPFTGDTAFASIGSEDRKAAKQPWSRIEDSIARLVGHVMEASRGREQASRTAPQPIAVAVSDMGLLDEGSREQGAGSRDTGLPDERRPPRGEVSLPGRLAGGGGSVSACVSDELLSQTLSPTRGGARGSGGRCGDELLSRTLSPRSGGGARSSGAGGGTCASGEARAPSATRLTPREVLHEAEDTGAPDVATRSAAAQRLFGRGAPWVNPGIASSNPDTPSAAASYAHVEDQWAPGAPSAPASRSAPTSPERNLDFRKRAQALALASGSNLPSASRPWSSSPRGRALLSRWGSGDSGRLQASPGLATPRTDVPGFGGPSELSSHLQVCVPDEGMSASSIRPSASEDSLRAFLAMAAEHHTDAAEYEIVEERFSLLLSSRQPQASGIAATSPAAASPGRRSTADVIIDRRDRGPPTPMQVADAEEATAEAVAQAVVAQAVAAVGRSP